MPYFPDAHCCLSCVGYVLWGYSVLVETMLYPHEMRVFHFVNAEFGLEDIRKRRRKIATLNELNDPFEFFGVNLVKPELRHAFHVMKTEMAASRGLLCFSRGWHNPLIWSHYADKHAGLCLGFDVPDVHLGEVTYLRYRLVVDDETLVNPRSLSPKEASKLIFSKYEHWSYEDEERCFVTLEEKDSEKNLYFADYSEQLKLRVVIVGATSTITKIAIQDALGELTSSVEVFKAALSFESFRVERASGDRV